LIGSPKMFKIQPLLLLKLLMNGMGGFIRLANPQLNWTSALLKLLRLKL